MADPTPSDAGKYERHVPEHQRPELERLKQLIDQGDPLWPAQLTVAVAIVLSLTLSNQLVFGPRWLFPAVEGLLLVALIIAAPPGANRVRSQNQRRLLWVTLGLVTLTYLIALGLLVHYLVKGGQTGGRALVGSGVILWVNNVLIFSVTYWDLDRGGPLNRFRRSSYPDFQFPQMENPELTPLHKDWQPTFWDYLYTSLTNATAFSPTDTMPITQIAKLLMGIQATAAITTIGLVLARAVNILGT